MADRVSSDSTRAMADADRMVVAHVLPWFSSATWGGTEQYVASLAPALRAHGIDSLVIVPSDRPAQTEETQAGVAVIHVPTLDYRAALAGVFATHRVDVVNVHGWTPRCGIDECSAARAGGLGVVLTVHIPSLVCARGTMLRDGRTPCDGVIRTPVCARCWMRMRGLPAPLASAIAALPRFAARSLAAWTVGSRASAAFGSTLDMDRRRSELAWIAGQVDRVVAPSRWLAQALIDNGLPAAQVVCCGQGVDTQWSAQLRASAAVRDPARLDVLFSGRWDVVKGVDVLVRAVRALPVQCPVRLTLACSHALGEDARRYRAEVFAAIDADPRIVVTEGLDRQALAGLYARSHVLAVPSQWFETGPIVVLEGLAAGCHVVGSDLGGITERLHGRADATLLPFDDVRAWTRTLESLCRQRATLSQAAGRADVRDTAELASDIAGIYHDARRCGAVRRASA